MQISYIHPNTPPRLVKAFRRAGSYHKLADERGVNVAHVYNLIMFGREPRKEEIRLALFLPRRPRKHHKPRAPRTPIQKAITRMARETKEAFNV